ncbi:MAG: cell division protein FtsI/penicillin-binding protein 2 [Planctomycetota bacterium]
MSREPYETASGLRPAGIYMGIVVVLLLVCGRAWFLATHGDHTQPTGSVKVERLPAPDFDIVDRDRASLAMSVQRMDLRLSPRSMWQAHTPREMAQGVVDLVGGGVTVESLLAEFFPSAKAGVIRIKSLQWRMGFDEARRVERWAHELGIDDHLWVERAKDRAEYRLHWRPVELLSRETRSKHSLGKKVIAPIVWTRILADGLLEARAPVGAGARSEEEEAQTFKELEHQRSLVWRALIPCADTIAIKDLPATSVLGLVGLLDAQFVQSHQMSIKFDHERVYPVREQLAGAAAWGVLGNWRYVSEERASELAAAQEPNIEKRADLARRLLDAKHPQGGLEGIAANLLAREDFEFIDPESAIYHYRKNVAVHQKSRRYFYEDSSEGATPRVFTTIDSDLQEFLHQTLRATAEEHRAAATMGIVIDVASGDVLAVDGYSVYDVYEFLPTWHLFSPGSTFKVVVMATALEAGVVEPTDEFDTYNGNYRIPNSGRTIHEAKGAPRGKITAATAISRSVNAVMVQIGMKVPDHFFYEKLMELGYYQIAGSGIGVERVGWVTDLPWTPAYTHASVSFGHEVSVTLWQHAKALGTILRGGISRPLRLISGVEWGDSHYELYLEEGQRVFSERACAQVREMMAEGARTGTGRHISKREDDVGTRIELLSKTGTTEKEPNVPCLHLELECNLLNSKLTGGRSDPDYILLPEMKAKEKPHSGSCYTSSICLVGKIPGEEREVMVLMVVDEPRVKLKFGSDVAGPAAISLLKESLGLTQGGQCSTECGEFVQAYGYEDEAEGAERPWLMREAVNARDAEYER